MRWARLIGSFGILKKSTPFTVTPYKVYNEFVHTTIPDMHYVACWTENDGIYSCGHAHATVRDAMLCLVPDGGSFIRAHDTAGFRSLRDDEYIRFLEALRDMPWSLRNKTQGSGPVLPLTATAE